MDKVSVFRCLVSGFKKTPIGWKAISLESLKVRKLPGFLASWPSGYELSATNYFA
jgi:hypothetical protein